MSLKLKKRDFSAFCILLALCLPFALRLTGSVSNLLSSHTYIIGLSLILTLVVVVNFNQIITSNVLFMLICNLIMLAANLAINGDWGVVIIFYNVTMTIIIFNNISFSSKWVKRIRVTTIILLAALFLSFSYEMAYGTLYAYDGGVILNPNTLGILWMIFLFTVISTLIDISIRKGIKYLLLLLLLLLVTVLSMMMIWFSRCRSALLAASFFFILLLLKKINFKKWLIFIIMFGLAFPVLYVWLYNMIGNVEILGKSLFSGRQEVWIEVWKQIKMSPIIGTGTTYQIEWNGNITDSSHNTYLGFWKTLGIVPLFSFVYFLIKGSSIIVYEKKNIVARKAFLAGMLVCVVETFLNDPNYNFLCLLLLLNIETTEISPEKKGV